MTHTVVVKDVPGDQLAQVMQDFRDAGATDVSSAEQPNGLFTVIAVFPDTVSLAALSALRSRISGYADVSWEAPPDI